MKLKNIIKKVALFFCSTILLIFILTLFINIYIISYSKRYIIKNISDLKENYECIIVLGASVKSNGNPSLMLKDRLDKSIELYKFGVSKKLLMSGDHSSYNYNEVSAMKKYAINDGVPSSDVFLDHYGINTYNSMYRLKNVYAVNKNIIVTQSYHLYRAIFIARKLGVNAYGVEAKKVNYNGQLYRELREALARVKDFVNIIVKPKSTYINNTIPVVGNGDVTDNREFIK